MKESEKLIINNVVVNNGIKEYGVNEIYLNPKIRTLVNNAIAFSNIANIYEKINNEKGILYITSNSDFSSWKSELRNVSNELLDTWNQN
jgi:hypothetical protein